MNSVEDEKVFFGGGSVGLRPQALSGRSRNKRTDVVETFNLLHTHMHTKQLTSNYRCFPKS